MKLIVQIPCFNEEKTLPEVVASIPRKIAGIDKVEILVIDDGSTDRTVDVARQAGVDHIIRNRRNMGLGMTFRRALDESLHRGADIIVNTDGDNQYCNADIPKLVAPIVRGEADFVIGCRNTDAIDHFSKPKRLLQKLGSRIVRRLSGVDVPDAVSGFRALSRDAALKINILSRFSYTIEMLIQIGNKRISYASVPVRTNPKTRDSRLFGSIREFIAKSVAIILRIYTMYTPLKVFTALGVVLALIGILPMVRFLFFFLVGDYGGHIQSLVIGGTFLVMG
ncbi:MAG: glycosyltransferase family 2 protein, partial [Alphaproteobacteria bacterium]|nr:glycosyltransferase family 2 protein [Alphaproteobacteria bacterium]